MTEYGKKVVSNLRETSKRKVAMELNFLILEHNMTPSKIFITARLTPVNVSRR
jgi:hypothetical protein